MVELARLADEPVDGAVAAPAKPNAKRQRKGPEFTGWLPHALRGYISRVVKAEGWTLGRNGNQAPRGFQVQARRPTALASAL